MRWHGANASSGAALGRPMVHKFGEEGVDEYTSATRTALEYTFPPYFLFAAREHPEPHTHTHTHTLSTQSKDRST